jgi:hypothetical protein
MLNSLRRANVAGLRIASVSLERCAFFGAFNLDRLRIEGEPLFARTRGWRSRRKIISEEMDWRYNRRQVWFERLESVLLKRHVRSFPQLQTFSVLDPVSIAALYRDLRKSREDAKDEPGAADFYYCEMEMRRHDRTSSRAERFILWMYWLVSGYGLRGLRSLTCLSILIAGFAICFRSVGFLHPRSTSLWGSALYAAESIISLEIIV